MHKGNYGYIPIPEEIYKKVHDAFPVGNMAMHDVSYDKQNLKYLGSRMISGRNLFYDYYQGPDGRYWHDTRGIVDGKIVSCEMAIFGKEVKKKRWKKR
jgi:hypothetical protein